MIFRNKQQTHNKTPKGSVVISVSNPITKPKKTPKLVQPYETKPTPSRNTNKRIEVKQPRAGVIISLYRKIHDF